mmetsp:Transcript_12167/g.20777  ORF Transcript_12167/g.20777 Transcript_12167/m.20777 type:complete len:296 (-) Transcript_12167:796-1683(-)
MHRHRRAARLGGEAELARLRVANLLPFPLLLLPLKVRVAPLVHQLFLPLVVLLRALLKVLQLLLEDRLVGLVVLIVRVGPVRVVGQVLALHLDHEVEHVALLHVLLVLDVRVEGDLDLGEVREEEVDVEVLRLRQVGEDLAPLGAAKLLHLVDRAGRLGGGGGHDAVEHLDALLVKVRQLQQVVGVEPHGLREELRALDDVHRAGDEALLHRNVEEAVEKVVHVLEHRLHVCLERGSNLLAQKVGVHERLHLHDVVVDVALVLDKVFRHAPMELSNVLRLRVLAWDRLLEFAGGG